MPALKGPGMPVSNIVKAMIGEKDRKVKMLKVLHHEDSG
jgi:hypothetical protein